MSARQPLPILDAQELKTFFKDLQHLRKTCDTRLGNEDAQHLYKIERRGRWATFIGWLTAWIAPNPISILALSLGRSTRWLLMHHVSHGGYDRVPNMPARYQSKQFAVGKRRWLDWFDWMTPEAWRLEHNVLHHGFTGQDKDPDLIERNATTVRDSSLSMPLRHLLIALLSITWRFSYYAPNTMRALLNKQGLTEEVEGFALFKHVLKSCLIPYGIFHFVLVPLLFFPLGLWAVFSVFCNSLLADLLTNFHTFLVVGPNHTGDDLYRFSERPKSSGEYYLQQIVGSVNYKTGTEWLDYGQLWLNYQIEHHLWPDLPMLQYRLIQPEVKTLCQQYGIPYLQESVWTRFRKMWRVFSGEASMRNYESDLEQRRLELQLSSP